MKLDPWRRLRDPAAAASLYALEKDLRAPATKSSWEKNGAKLFGD